MMRPYASLLRALCATIVLAACALLSACGGGLIAGVGSGGSGVAEGTLSGFGSVIVDGIEYSELALSDADRSALRLGQRVRLVFGDDDTARSISVLAQLRGPVTAALDSGGWLRIGGQWVRVVQSNDDSSRSGITLLEGFESPGATPAIATGQDATAYGSWAWDGNKASYVLIATRVERLAVAADPVLLGGVAVSVSAGGFRLGSASGTAVAAAAASLPMLAEGAVVALQVVRSSLLAAGDGTVASVQALDVRDASLGALDLSGYQSVRIGGLINALDPSAGTVTIQGTRLNLAAGQATATGDGAGQFLRVEAAGGSGNLAAGSAMQRGGSPVGMPRDDGTGSVTELKGLLGGVNWSAASVSFTLRGVNVLAESGQVAQACRDAASGQTLYVTVTGYSPSPTAPLRANAVNCTSDLSAASDV